ncbi:radical SAM protein [Candidatus Berkelbacteria bacterium]|nr:radical SAM protein [Candidatus Berkelbacteria bacterium]
MPVVASRYNFHVPVAEGILLFNAASGWVIRLTGADGPVLGRALTGSNGSLELEAIPAELCEQLVAGGFLVPRGVDEVPKVRETYWRARRDTPMVLTLTTTLDCNLGCYYCYEERSTHRLQIADVEAVVSLAADRLQRSGRRRLHVDWYGGEPLMNIEFLEETSAALQARCRSLDVQYAASIISNGTCWPKDVGAFIHRHRVQQVQISFDGLKTNHERRRRYRPAHVPPRLASSFDRAVSLVDRLLDHVRVDIRLNIDSKNVRDVVPFIRFARSRGWFDRAFPAVIQPARLSSYSERSSFMRKSELSGDRFEQIRQTVREEAAGRVTVEESEAPDGFPHPRSSVCAALALDSIVVGADRRLHRCGLTVSEPLRAVGQLKPASSNHLPILAQPGMPESGDDRWWRDFDPTCQPSCSRCSFLPICWGGCAKKHLERDEHALAEQSLYWRRNLPRLVAAGVGSEVESGFVYGEADQFR